LRKEYWPLIEYAWEPLKAGGVKIVWHCDGDVRLLLPEVLACGADGLQGFQRQCGMDLDWIVDLRTRQGNPLLIFGPMEVVTLFRNGSPEDIRQEVKHSMDLCRDKASLVFFTSNTITPDIPLENILMYWQTVLESPW
jgi:uroporphyrinogen decarboxylase